MKNDDYSKALKKQLIYLQTLLDCLSSFNESINVSEGLRNLLKIIGQFYDAKSIFVFEYGDEDEEIGHVYRWDSDDRIERFDSRDIDMPKSVRKCWTSDIKKNHAYFLPKEKKYKKDTCEKCFLYQTAPDTDAIIAPIIVGDKIIGSATIEGPKKNVDQVELLESILRFVSNGMMKKKSLNQKMLDGLASMYMCMYYLDPKEKSFSEIKCDNMEMREIIGTNGTCEELYDNVRATAKKGFKNIVKKNLNRDNLYDTFENKNSRSFDYQNSINGWTRVTYTTIERDENGISIKAILTMQDINDDKKKEVTVNYELEHDALTGAFNRTALERIKNELDDERAPIALIIADLDFFKKVNDTYGHAIGDVILKKVVTTLKKFFRSSDYVVRFGGDEFLVVMKDVFESDFGMIEEKIKDVNAALVSDTEGIPTVTISVGVAFSENGFDKGLMERADHALYIVKETRRGGVRR